MYKWLIALVGLAGCFSTLLAQPTPKDSVRQLLSKREVCMLPFNESLIDTNAFEGVYDARNGNLYSIPKGFIDKHIDVMDTVTGELLSDTAYYLNTAGDVSIKMWDGYYISTSIAVVGKKVTPIEILKARAYVDNMYAITCVGGLPQLGEITILKSCKAMHGYSFSYSTYGENDAFGYVYKCLVTELAVSGDLMATHMVIRFPKHQTAKYLDMAIYLANNFKGRSY